MELQAQKGEGLTPNALRLMRLTTGIKALILFALFAVAGGVTLGTGYTVAGIVLFTVGAAVCLIYWLLMPRFRFRRDIARLCRARVSIHLRYFQKSYALRALRRRAADGISREPRTAAARQCEALLRHPFCCRRAAHRNGLFPRKHVRNARRARRGCARHLDQAVGIAPGIFYASPCAKRIPVLHYCA